MQTLIVIITIVYLVSINFYGIIENVKIYIKIKLVANVVVPIISFHEAEF